MSTTEPSFRWCWVSATLFPVRVPVHPGRVTGHVVGWTKVHDRHAEEFLAGVAVEPHRRVVDREEAERVHVEHPHRLRVGFEEQAVAAVCFLGIPIESHVLDRQRGPLAQLDGELEVGLGEVPAIFPGGSQTDHPGGPAAGPERHLDEPGWG